MSKFRGKKTNNAKTTAKKEIRESVLRAIESPRALEVFCGSGEMYASVWNRATKYLGIDKIKQFDERQTICGDARKAIRKIDLSEFNIFDIDAYGSPYEILLDIVCSIPAKLPIGFVITDGINMDLKLGRICKGMRDLTGIDQHIAKRANVIHDELIQIVINNVSKRLGGKAKNIKIATGKTGSCMKYYSFIVSDAV